MAAGNGSELVTRAFARLCEMSGSLRSRRSNDLGATLNLGTSECRSNLPTFGRNRLLSEKGGNHLAQRSKWGRTSAML